MSDFKSKRNKHLTLDDRIEIQECLNKGVSFKAIAGRIGKDPTTVSKEVKKRAIVKEAPVRTTKPDGTPVEAKTCPELMKVPFVCNPCKKSKGNYCSFQKRVYIAKVAQDGYATLLVESREGIALNSEEFWEADRVISNAVKKGQRLYHVMQSNDIGFSMSTAYRHIEKGHLSICNIDLPRKVKFKPRKKKPVDSIPKAAKVGRSYNDFRAYIDGNNITDWVEMDTVLGTQGGKAILTIHFTLTNFMFGLLLDNLTAAESADKIRTLKETLLGMGIHFGERCPIILTDNGGEFAHVQAFINSPDGSPETMLFFCDPYCSSQKARVEKNHTLFRDIVPRGESFDLFTQDTVNIIFSHINSVKRGKLGGKSPYESFVYFFGGAFPSAIGITEIPPDEVTQHPRLLRLLMKQPPEAPHPANGARQQDNRGCHRE